MTLEIKFKVNEAINSVASIRNLGTTFSAGGLIDFLNTSNILLICTALYTFSHFFLAVFNIRISEGIFKVFKKSFFKKAFEFFKKPSARLFCPFVDILLTLRRCHSVQSNTLWQIEPPRGKLRSYDYI